MPLPCGESRLILPVLIRILIVILILPLLNPDS